MKTEEFKDLIRPIVYKYGSGWLLDAPEMLEEICKKYHRQQLLIHSVSNRYQVTDIKLADWESVAIGDTKTNKIICHFITENGFDEAFEIAKKITKFLNGC